MKPTKIYQTLEYRNNNKEIEEHGPYFCTLRDERGRIKTGAKTPWLGEGYYFGILVLKMQDGGARLYIVIKVMLFVERLTMLIPPFSMIS